MHSDPVKCQAAQHLTLWLHKNKLQILQKMKHAKTIRRRAKAIKFKAKPIRPCGLPLQTVELKFT